VRRFAAFLSIALAACAAKTPQEEPAVDLAIVGARIYTSPDSAPVHGTVRIRDGRIVDIVPGDRAKIPSNVRLVDGAGQVVTAGFWNSHVHFIERKWEAAATAPAEVLSHQLSEMFVRYGFTTVVDTGSSWPITSSLRRRLQAGELTGPDILTSGEILFPKDGAPHRLPAAAKGEFISGEMQEVDAPEEAVALARRKLDAGADAIKLYVATWFHKPAKRIAPETVRAVVHEVHRRGKPALAHPSDVQGIETALAGGVDVLMHTTPAGGLRWSDDLVKRMKEQRVAVVPTLTLWRVEMERERVPEPVAQKIRQTAVEQLRAYASAGGVILFGTDVGYIPVQDPREEYALMASAGLSYRQLLASLTTAPAAQFGGGKRTGRIAPGEPADLVMLGADPAQDVGAFTRVVRVLKGGRTVFEAERQLLPTSDFLLRLPTSIPPLWSSS
jgi:imidazolonepropionase-like amidohydrolase